MTTNTQESAFDFEAISSAWTAFCRASGIPADYNGDSAFEAHAGAEKAQELIRNHIVATNDYRLFALLHLLGNASLLMEQVIDPEGYARTTAAIEKALQDAELDQEGWVSHEEAIATLKKSLITRG